MKKLCCIVICLCCVLSLVSCSPKQDIGEITTNSEQIPSASDVFEQTTEVETVFDSESTTKKHKETEQQSSEPDKFEQTTKIKPTQAPESTTEKQVNIYEIYKQYFYKHYDNSNLVCIVDVTHDEKEDMIVFEDNPQTNASFDEYIVYTAPHGEVEEIYREVISINRTNIMLVNTAEGSNLVYEFRGIWQGIGTASCKEFYFTNSGEMIQVNLIEQEYGGNRDVLDSLYNDSEAYFNYIEEANIIADEEYYKKIGQRYGDRFSDAYLLYTTGDSMANNNNTKNIEITASEVFEF